MKPKIILALIITAATCGRATVMDFRVTPTNITRFPISVRVTDDNFGKRIAVFYKTNETTMDEFLHSNLTVGDEDNQIARCAVEQLWRTNGVEFVFTIADAYVSASRFYLWEEAHSGKRPISSVWLCWFYLRDFVTNSVPGSVRTNSDTVSPEIVKELPRRVKALRPGTSREQVWKQLRLTPYEGHLAGVSSFPEKEQYWLTWNYELELVYENKPGSDSANRKLVRAALYKNGRKISDSGK
ncbi:MAG: hypothetical protein HY298_19070 [Verrucomicrobia bacterium]|nr:hypothetical protein [Verrucomicrobiota bacterium]